MRDGCWSGRGESLKHTWDLDNSETESNVPSTAATKQEETRLVEIQRVFCDVIIRDRLRQVPLSWLGPRYWTWSSGCRCDLHILIAAS